MSKGKNINGIIKYWKIRRSRQPVNDMPWIIKVLLLIAAQFRKIVLLLVRGESKPEDLNAKWA